MNNSSKSLQPAWLGYTVVILFAALGFFGFPTLFVVLDFFSLEGGSMQETALWLSKNGTMFQLAVSALIVAYILFAPVALIITKAAFIGKDENSLFAQLTRGLIWAGLALRSWWWVALLIFAPMIVDKFGPASTASAVEQTAIETTYSMITNLLNSLTEDVGVNIFGGLWFILTCVAMLRGKTFGAGYAVIGILIGLTYILSSGDIFGINFFSGGNPIPTLVSVAGPVWLLITGLVSVRKLSKT